MSDVPPDTFDVPATPRLIVGAGTLARLPEVLGELGGARPLIVTDEGVVGAGHVEAAEEALRGAGIAAHRFADVPENPAASDVARAAAVAREVDPDVLVGLGGGSAIDVAKGVAFLLAGGGRMEDYRGKGTGRGVFLPLVAIPTTAGTGTETQSFALIQEDDTHGKMACGDPRALPRVAILDPALHVTMPRAVTAVTGLDALGHAVETAVCRARTPVSVMRSREAFRRLDGAFGRVLDTPEDLGARRDMAVGAALAGAAIEASMLGAAHALANPLTARFGVTHGHAVALMLPGVVRFNGEDPEIAAEYAALLRAAGHPAGPDGAPRVLSELLEKHVLMTGLEPRLGSLGVAEEDLAALALGATEQWTAGFNPRPLSTSEAVRLLRDAL